MEESGGEYGIEDGDDEGTFNMDMGSPLDFSSSFLISSFEVLASVDGTS